MSANEYLDILDEHYQVIGQEKRQIVHQTGLLHRGVHLFLFTPDRKMLVQQRSPTQDTFPGALDCSVSEHLQVGESYLAGAQRGVREELGVEIATLQRRLWFKMAYGPHDYMLSELYEGVCDANAITVDTQEVDSITYDTIPEIERLMTAEAAEFTPWFEQFMRWYTGQSTRMTILWERTP
ncbi:MAG: NUDIX domain-containing protein [Anaerolineae bacterium]|nr:NUDIX domain-containing protein [Anaerolineae bacterium]